LFSDTHRGRPPFTKERPWRKRHLAGGSVRLGAWRKKESRSRKGEEIWGVKNLLAGKGKKGVKPATPCRQGASGGTNFLRFQRERVSPAALESGNRKKQNLTCTTLSRRLNSSRKKEKKK